MKKAKLVSDGTPSGTHVYDENGEELKMMISAVTWRIEANNLGVMTVEFPMVEIDAVGDLKGAE
jgi:hypothetical protein